MNVYIIILLISGFLIAYSYAIYPLLLFVKVRYHRNCGNQEQPSPLPMLSVVVAAHNEDRVIERKISNSVSLSYPVDRFEILIGSDGSTDGTDAICGHHKEIRFVRIEPRKGKANVLNTLIPLTRGEIILFSDANTIIDPLAPKAIVKHFSDPSVGGVCGRLVLTSSLQRLEATESTYWNYETRIKEMESHCGSTIGANGGIYAIRRELFSPLPIDTIIDDFLVSLNILERGKRLVFEGDAVAYEEVSKSFRDEFMRKVRIGAGNLQVLLRKASFFFKVRPFIAFAYISHKVIRWLVPFLLIAMWICSYILSDSQPYFLVFWAYNLSILLALMGLTGLSSNRFVKALAYGYSLNCALLIGYARYLLGIQRSTWRRAQR